MRIRWTNAAAADMQSISDYLKDHHPHYRQPTMRKLYERIRALKDAPYIGRPGREEGNPRDSLSAHALCSCLPGA
jgi:plasmid stabilization system protein ParE